VHKDLKVHKEPSEIKGIWDLKGQQVLKEFQDFKVIREM
jgi:hypothetical protein